VRRAGLAARRLTLLASFVATSCTLPRWPVDAPLTSAYGLRFRGWRPDIHEGVDLDVDEGTPVRAMTRGTVLHAGPLGAYGLTVILRHGRNVQTLYAHLSRVDVRRGEEVAHQQVIALSGHTGNATGPHLHFEVRRWGRTEDPVPLLGAMPSRKR
jgi:murein DD-endopeptidase MepM/ murein hydrolase activator NlpD